MSKEIKKNAVKLPKKKLSLEGTELGRIIKRHDKELIIEDFASDSAKATKMHKHSYEELKDAYDKGEINLWTYTKILRKKLVKGNESRWQYYIAIQNLIKKLEPDKNRMYSKMVELARNDYISPSIWNYLRKTAGKQPFPDEVFKDYLIASIKNKKIAPFYAIKFGAKLLNDEQRKEVGKVAVNGWKKAEFINVNFENIKLLKAEDIFIRKINNLDASDIEIERPMYNLMYDVNKMSQSVKVAVIKKGREFLRNHKSDLLEPLIEPAKYVDKQTEKIVKGAKKLPTKKLKLTEGIDYAKIIDPYEVYYAGCEGKNFNYKKGLDALIRTDEDGFHICMAGGEWKEFDYEKGLDALIERKRFGGIHQAGIDWKEFDYDKGMKALEGTKFHEQALKEWPKGIKQVEKITKDLQTKSKKLPGKKLSLESALEEIMGDITNQSATTKKSKAYKKARKKFRKNLLAMDYEKEVLKEGAEDRGIFKAIFLLGSPGSGKSQIAKHLLQGTAGWKTINPDVMYEYLMKKEKIPIDYKKRTKEQEKRHGEHEIVAREKLLKQEEQYLKGRLPIVIDRTGYHYEAVLRHANALKSVGYEVGMIFVDTPQDVALKRNLARKRKLDVEFIKKYDPKIRVIIPHYEKLFGSKFWHVKNIEEITKERKHGELQKIREDIFKWLSKRPDNAKVREWMKTAKEKI